MDTFSSYINDVPITVSGMKHPLGFSSVIETVAGGNGLVPKNGSTKLIKGQPFKQRVKFSKALHATEHRKEEPSDAQH